MRPQIGIVIVAALTAVCPALAQDAGNLHSFGGGGGASADIVNGLAIQLYGLPPKGIFIREWHSDVPGGKVGGFRLPVQCARRASLVLRLDDTNLDRSGQYVPAITMALTGAPYDGPEDDNSERTELVLFGNPAGSRSSYYFYKTENGKRGERIPIGSADFHEETTVLLSWNDKNEVTAKVGMDKPLTLAMNYAPASLALSISGAVATFFDVNVEFVPGRPSNIDCVKSSNAPSGTKPPQ